MVMNKLILGSFLLMAACGKKGGSNDSQPNMTFDDITVNEGNAGTTNIEIRLKLNKASSKQVSVKYTTVEGTAKATSDYTAASAQTVTFQANETEKTITIAVLADDL
jgi:hypothetical protein